MIHLKLYDTCIFGPRLHETFQIFCSILKDKKWFQIEDCISTEIETVKKHEMKSRTNIVKKNSLNVECL